MSLIRQFLLLPWRRYSDFFDKSTWGIWGLSPILKSTIVRKLEKSFQEESIFYIREENGKIHIIAPHEQ